MASPRNSFAFVEDPEALESKDLNMEQYEEFLSAESTTNEMIINYILKEAEAYQLAQLAEFEEKVKQQESLKEKIKKIKDQNEKQV